MMNIAQLKQYHHYRKTEDKQKCCRNCGFMDLSETRSGKKKRYCRLLGCMVKALTVCDNFK